MEAPRQVLTEAEVRELIPDAPRGKALVLVGIGSRMYKREPDDRFHLLDNTVRTRSPKELAIDEP